MRSQAVPPVAWRSSGLWRWAAVRALLLLGLGCAWLPSGQANVLPSLFALQDTWLNEHGQPVQLAQWRGRPTVVAMEYSACRFICSAYWLRLQAVQAEADRQGQDLQFVILSIDPDNDSPAAWRDYRRARQLARGNWHFLTASRAATHRAAARLGVRWWYTDGHLMHDFKIVRLDADGGIAAAMTRYDEPPGMLVSRP